MIGVNQVEGLTSDAAKGSFVQEVLSRAYSLHVLVSAMPGWHWSVNQKKLAVDEHESLELLVSWLSECSRKGSHRKKRSR
jgi:hypothetical protein